ALAVAQVCPIEYHYLDIDPLMHSLRPDVNPASLSPENIPYNYAFQYRNRTAGGDFRLPFTPERKSYQHVSVSAFREMENGLLFAGQFTYRYEQRKNKLWLHNAETHLDIPFYFADSSAGDFDLNGIDWNILFSYPISRHLRGAVDIFYNVDEQFKTVFPKPNIKRNDVLVRPGFALTKARFQLGVSASFFQFKEEMNTRRYSLEQGLSPTFMRIRGLDKPFLTYAQTSEERRQTISGYGIAGNMNAGDMLSLSSEYESSRAAIVDGGAWPVPQGNWELHRFAFRSEIGRKAVIFFEYKHDNAEGFHPVLERRIYAHQKRYVETGISLPYRPSSKESWTGSVSYAFCDLLREDNFTGLLYYFPENLIRLNMHYSYDKKAVRYEMEFAYDILIDAAESVIYDDRAGWYFAEITKSEIAYYEEDCSQLKVALKVSMPAGKNRIQFSADLARMQAKFAETRYMAAHTGVAVIF
ncbi:MAG: hypothetical protein K0B52_01585, partial [FCB group bacterium]|nr:hypothetical protein [FCB group bacterium]